MPAVSILLPTHNRADVLPFAIRSVLWQTVADFELLVVGDGCTDETAQVLARFADARVRWFDLPKAPGFGYANRNIALRQAAAPLIAYMQHDDLWLPDHLQLLTTAFADPAVEWAYTRPLWVAPEGDLSPSAFDLRYSHVLASFLARRRNHIPILCVMHRRAALEKYGYWDETIPQGGDVEIWTRMIRSGGGHNFAYVPVPTSLHFRALWRRTEPVRPRGRVTDDLRQSMRALWPALALPIPPGVTEQEAAWQIIAADPAEWASAVRRAVQESEPFRMYTHNEIAHRLEELVVQLEAELEGLRQSRGVRLLMLLRQWRWRLAQWLSRPR